MSDIRVQFVYNGQVRTGTVEFTDRSGLITLKLDNPGNGPGYKSFKCDGVTQVEYLP